MVKHWLMIFALICKTSNGVNLDMNSIYSQTHCQNSMCPPKNYIQMESKHRKPRHNNQDSNLVYSQKLSQVKNNKEYELRKQKLAKEIVDTANDQDFLNGMMEQDIVLSDC